MSYIVQITEEAKSELRKITPADRERILKYLDKNISQSENPRAFGKALVGNKAGLWRYRVGAYRVVCEVFDNVLIVKALHIGHRSQIYDIF